MPKLLDFFDKNTRKIGRIERGVILACSPRTELLRLKSDISNAQTDGQAMITSAQLKAARALLGIDQRALAESAGLSVPTIQRMEASVGVIRGNVESLTKLVFALTQAGVELIGEDAASQAKGRGVRLSK